MTPSADETALLSAVEAHPADDLPRLVYADWLDEHGQHVRAEFIRLQCEIAKLEAGPRAVVNQHIPLWRRQQDLLEHHLPELLGPGREGLAGSRVEFDRGFVVQVAMVAGEFIEHGALIAGLMPTPRVAVRGVGHALGEFLSRAGGHLDLVSAVEMQSGPTSRPARLNYIRGAAFRRASDWSRLQSLDAAGCAMGDDGADHLIREGAFPVLVDLDLSENNLTDAGVVDLLNSGLLSRLSRLVLGGNPLTDQSAFELADRLGQANRLEHLNLRFTDIGPAGQQALLARFGGKVSLF